MIKVTCPHCNSVRAITETKTPLNKRAVRCFICERTFNIAYRDKSGLHFRIVEKHTGLNKIQD